MSVVLPYNYSMLRGVRIAGCVALQKTTTHWKPLVSADGFSFTFRKP
jgi:hypothetical protein